MHWILQNNLFNESEYESMISNLDRFDIQYSIHKVVPFVGELIPEPILNTHKVVCFGSYSMRHTAKKYGWDPGVYDLFEMNFLRQLEHWGDRMLNADSEIVQFKDAKIDEPTFIRPIDDSKYFAGKVFDPEEFNKWQHDVCELKLDFGNSLTPETMIQLCKPKEIYAEYRYWIVDGRIVTRSLYKRGGRVIYSPDVDSEFDMYVSSLISSMCNNSWNPHKAFVLDVCDTPNGTKIVEINTINAAGFYAGDIQAIILALENMEGRSNVR